MVLGHGRGCKIILPATKTGRRGANEKGPPRACGPPGGFAWRRALTPGRRSAGEAARQPLASAGAGRHRAGLIPGGGRGFTGHRAGRRSSGRGLPGCARPCTHPRVWASPSFAFGGKGERSAPHGSIPKRDHQAASVRGGGAIRFRPRGAACRRARGSPVSRAPGLVPCSAPADFPATARPRRGRTPPASTRGLAAARRPSGKRPARRRAARGSGRRPRC
jgi:hypothetical protein